MSTKIIIEKLTGNKKFEVDEKLGASEFFKLVETVSDANISNEDELLLKLEASLQGSLVCKDDQENFIYKKLVQVIKEMKKSGKK